MTKQKRRRVARKLVLPLIALAMMVSAMAAGAAMKPSPMLKR